MQPDRSDIGLTCNTSTRIISCIDLDDRLLDFLLLRLIFPYIKYRGKKIRGEKGEKAGKDCKFTKVNYNYFDILAKYLIDMSLE